MLIIALAASLGAAQSDGVCPPGTELVEEKRVETATAIYIQPVCQKVAVDPGKRHDPYRPEFETDEDFIRAMLKLAAARRWPANEVRRLQAALEKLSASNPVPLDAMRARAIWNGLPARSTDAELRAAADKGNGPRLFRSGWQAGQYADCAVFALASAAGLPYGIVAASADELLRAAEWRIDADRRQPERIYKQAGGLNGGEVIMLAEQFGRAQVIAPKDFAAVLASQKPILLSISTGGRTQHEVVLSRTFRHQGQDWFELIDSQQVDPRRRLFLSAEELHVIARENGVTVIPEPGGTPKLLRTE
jgi:hypothetical protein